VFFELYDMRRDYLFAAGILSICSFMLSACGSVTGGSPPNTYNGAVFISDRDNAGTNELFISDREAAEISKLSDTLVSGGNVKSFLVNSNIGFIAYLADQDIVGVLKPVDQSFEQMLGNLRVLFNNLKQLIPGKSFNG